MPKKKYQMWFESPEEEMKSAQKKMPGNAPKMFSLSNFPMIKMMRAIPLNIIDAGDKIIVRAEMPGYEKEDIKLKVTEDTIHITAEKKRQHIEQGEKMIKQSGSFSSASRSSTLPVKVKTDAKAKFDNGILEVTLEKKEKLIKKKETQVRIH